MAKGQLVSWGAVDRARAGLGVHTLVLEAIQPAVGGARVREEGAGLGTRPRDEVDSLQATMLQK